MHCPFCGHVETKVTDSRLAGEGRQIRRRRECLKCGERFTTFEAAELLMPMVIKGDRGREAFDEAKLRAGMEKALEKRPVPRAEIDEALSRVLHKVLSLAARGLASTDPNPRVGCVIAQGTQTVAEGWHARAGEAHAEVVALQAAGQQAAGATVYVTFEPCCHHGRTPPCVEALTQAGVARVVYAATDPNPQVNGRGAEALRAAGITVEAGLLEREALELNCGFVKRMQQGRPAPWGPGMRPRVRAGG